MSPQKLAELKSNWKDDLKRIKKWVFWYFGFAVLHLKTLKLITYKKMNEQDLISIWNEQDSTLEKSIAVNQQLLKSVTLGKVKSMLTLFRRT
jgi:hypothetical protein